MAARCRKFGNNNFCFLLNFLIEREHIVNVGAKLSHETIILSGVPQGTALGLLLVLYFSADINNINDSAL